MNKSEGERMSYPCFPASSKEACWEERGEGGGGGGVWLVKNEATLICCLILCSCPAHLNGERSG